MAMSKVTIHELSQVSCLWSLCAPATSSLMSPPALPLSLWVLEHVEQHSRLRVFTVALATSRSSQMLSFCRSQVKCHSCPSGKLKNLQDTAHPASGITGGCPRHPICISQRLSRYLPTD